jgi:hypothetical protein
MSGWAYYFLVKVYLHLRGHIPFDAVANLAFAGWLIVPTPIALACFRPVVWCVESSLWRWPWSWRGMTRGSRRWGGDRVPSGAGPPTAAYALRFVASLINPWVLITLGGISAATFVVNRYVRLTPVIIVLLILVAVGNATQPRTDLDRWLVDFYRTESQRVVRLPSPTHDFDVIVLQVCSLGWDDLEVAGLRKDPFWSRFDYVLTNFNSATSHSSPSAIRLLRAPCGQIPHDALYRDGDDACNLFDVLRRNGYRTYSAFNWDHDGTYMGFGLEVAKWGRLDPALAVGDLPVYGIDYDGRPIQGDWAVLERWWTRRTQDGARRAALYYNTISLHDGGRSATDREWWKRDRAVKYADFTRALFRDLERFFDLIEASGRDAAIFVVSEHGLGLRGSALQGPGLREIPLPHLTQVPLAVKLVGDGWARDPEPHVITKPTIPGARGIPRQPLCASRPGRAGACRSYGGGRARADWVARIEALWWSNAGEYYVTYRATGSRDTAVIRERIRQSP